LIYDDLYSIIKDDIYIYSAAGKGT